MDLRGSPVSIDALIDYANEHDMKAAWGVAGVNPITWWAELRNDRNDRIRRGLGATIDDAAESLLGQEARKIAAAK